MFEAKEIRRMLAAAKGSLKAMILLGVNCGFGNADCGTLPITALGNPGWVSFPRRKTGIDRRCPLWPKTVQAMKVAFAKRRAPVDVADAAIVFVTKYGQSWAKDPAAITKEFRKLLDKLHINGQRNFYCLRHTFETIAGEAKDQVAVDHIMGHARDDMASVYRERISDQRLKDVVAHVHNWLFGKGGGRTGKQPAKRRHRRSASK